MLTSTRLTLCAAFFLPFMVQAQEAEQRSEQSTGIADQTDVSVTIYNNDLALVRDRRNLSLDEGRVVLTFMDVAQQIRPETVSLRSVSDPGSIRILEQNYEYDLISPEKLMEKFVGREVRLVNFSNEVGFTEVAGRLISNNQGPIYQIEGEIFLGHPGTVVLPEIPENLIAKPSLIWDVETTAGDQEIEAGYLTRGISWKADYVLTLNAEETKMDVAAWVTLSNSSGAQYTDATLKIVAGDVNVVSPQRRGEFDVKMARAAVQEAAVEEAFGEYHLYTIPRRTTIKDNQTKQVSLMTASGVGVTKSYEFGGQGYYFAQRIPEPVKEKVAVFLEFDNEEENNLGVPLPGGIMRVYQADSSGALQFSGEDRIDHTPKDEEVRLRLGNAFDIVGERKQTDYTSVARNVHESSYEITLRNHKDTAVTVDVVERAPGDWEILSKSHDFERRDASTIVFPVEVPADGEAVLTYRIRVRY